MTMRKIRLLMIVGLVAMVAVFLAAPSAMAKKKALADEEMDLITAAGQPTIIQTGSGSITFTSEPEFTLDLESNSQTSLTALVLNNIAGENQIATGINVASLNGGNAETWSQTNSITQSWGATKDFSAVTINGVSVEGEDASASAVINADGDGSGPQCNTTDSGNVKCGIVKGAGGDGGSGNTATASTSTSPGTATVGKIGILSKYADQIIETVTGDISVHTNGTISLLLEADSQTGLAALVVNNIAGLNQVATAVNILSGDINFIGGISLANAGTQNIPLAQTNNITQCRGTPCTRPPAPVQ